jgi:hypothetical protein
MATNTVLAAGDISTPTIALAAAAVDTVTFGNDCDMVEVFTPDGTSAISFTVDGSVPAAGAKNTYYVPAVANSALEVTVQTGGNTVVKLISTGTPSYRVTRTN